MLFFSIIVPCFICHMALYSWFCHLDQRHTLWNLTGGLMCCSRPYEWLHVSWQNLVYFAASNKWGSSELLLQSGQKTVQLHVDKFIGKLWGNILSRNWPEVLAASSQTNLGTYSQLPDSAPYLLTPCPKLADSRRGPTYSPVVWPDPCSPMALSIPGVTLHLCG